MKRELPPRSALIRAVDRPLVLTASMAVWKALGVLTGLLSTSRIASPTAKPLVAAALAGSMSWINRPEPFEFGTSVSPTLDCTGAEAALGVTLSGSVLLAAASVLSVSSLTDSFCSPRSRQMVTSILVPGALLPIVRESERAPSTPSPSTAVMMSPDLIPALSAGEPLRGSVTTAPLASLRPTLSAMSRVTSWMPTPRKPRVTEPLLMRSELICLTVAAGMAKAIPTLPPFGEKIAVLTPTTHP